MTIQLPQDLASFVEDAVRTGAYDRADDVIRDALTRLQQAREVTAATTGQSGGIAPQEKPLTKQTLQRHLVAIGVLDQPATAPSEAPFPGQLSAEEEEEIISDVVIRERLIAWLVGFLSNG
jgi:Arc/MetJ-type ribon-helix-helix transcriptional regulator